MPAGISDAADSSPELSCAGVAVAQAANAPPTTAMPLSRKNDRLLKAL
jgi:hypothetical protein